MFVQMYVWGLKKYWFYDILKNLFATCVLAVSDVTFKIDLFAIWFVIQNKPGKRYIRHSISILKFE